VSEQVPEETVRAPAARFPEGTATPNGTALLVVIDKIKVWAKFILRQSGSSSVKWTIVGVVANDIPGPPLTFFVDIRHASASEERDVRAGRLRDPIIGDAEFDAAYIIEAAPKDVMRAWLQDRSLRRLEAENSNDGRRKMRYAVYADSACFGVGA
jgi:hypothetical protein